MSEELISNYDIRGTQETGLNVECAWNVGKALADWLPTSGSVFVVYDASQKDIANAVIEGIRLQGRAVVDGGLGNKGSVDAYFKSSQPSGAVVVGFDQLAKMITIELYEHQARLIDGSSGLGEIRSLVDAGNFVPAATRGELTHLA